MQNKIKKTVLHSMWTAVQYRQYPEEGMPGDEFKAFFKWNRVQLCGGTGSELLCVSFENSSEFAFANYNDQGWEGRK